MKSGSMVGGGPARAREGNRRRAMGRNILRAANGGALEGPDIPRQQAYRWTGGLSGGHTACIVNAVFFLSDFLFHNFLYMCHQVLLVWYQSIVTV